MDSDAAPDYAILSHTWESEEVSFGDIQDLEKAKSMKGYRKIDYTCQQALNDRLEYAWIDTCCIDKTSSAELSEAINSMFMWYERSHICYAFLQNVQLDTTIDRDDFELLRHSRWHTRGWTLQELIAPRNVVFYSRTWALIGCKKTLSRVLSRITYIDELLLHNPAILSAFSIAQRMSRAASRKTTRVEDEAYCLLGIMGVNMPLLYGERRRAFHRLQGTIMGAHNDHSILLWLGLRSSLVGVGRFPESPKAFVQGGDIVVLADKASSPLQPTTQGIRFSAPIFIEGELTMVVLDCRLKHNLEGPLALFVEARDTSVPSNGEGSFLVRRKNFMQHPVIPLSWLPKATVQQVLLLNEGDEYRQRRISEMQERPSLHCQYDNNFYYGFENVSAEDGSQWTSGIEKHFCVVQLDTLDQLGHGPPYIIWRSVHAEAYLILMLNSARFKHRHCFLKAAFESSKPNEERLALLRDQGDWVRVWQSADETPRVAVQPSVPASVSKTLGDVRILASLEKIMGEYVIAIRMSAGES